MFRLPNINGRTEAEKVSQLTDYLFQLIRELNLKMESIDKSIEEATKKQKE